MFVDDLLGAKVMEINPRYAESQGALLGQFRRLHSDIYANREFIEQLRNRGKFFDHEDKARARPDADGLRGTDEPRGSGLSIRRRRLGNGGLGHRSGQRASVATRGPHRGP